MQLINSYFEILPQDNTLEGVYEQIEKVGRTCYKSENNIQYDYYDFNDKLIGPNEEAYQKGWCKRKSKTAKAFVDMLIKSDHGAMLEHGTIYLDIMFPLNKDVEEINNRKHFIKDYLQNPYSRVYKLLEDNNLHYYITTNLRVLVENNWLDDLKYICKPTEYHKKRITVKFICDRGVSHEFVRHRVFSFAQESTRYCNYSKDKFGNELTFIIPSWLDIPEGFYSWKDSNPLVTAGLDVEKVGWDDSSNISYKPLDSKDNRYYEYKLHGVENFFALNNFLEVMQKDEDSYLYLLYNGCKPQQARQVLPNALKTELVMTGFIDDWRHFFDLRCDKSAHPDARKLAIALQEWFISNKLIND